jgi:hypothetical protein
MAIEYIQLKDSFLMQLIMYKTIDTDEDDTLNLGNFETLPNSNIDWQSIEDRFYYYTHEDYKLCSALIEHDMRAVPLPPHTAWWCIEDEYEYSPEDDRSFQHLIHTDTIRLNNELISLTEFRLAYDQYGQDIYVYDTQEVRYFFYRSTWEDALEDY